MPEPIGRLTGLALQTRETRDITPATVQQLSEKQLAYVEWLSTPREERPLLKDYAVQIGVSEATLWRWGYQPNIAQAVWERVQARVRTHAAPQIVHAQSKLAEQRVDSARLVLEAAGLLRAQDTADRRIQIAIVTQGDTPTGDVVDPFAD